MRSSNDHMTSRECKLLKDTESNNLILYLQHCINKKLRCKLYQNKMDKK